MGEVSLGCLVQLSTLSPDRKGPSAAKLSMDLVRETRSLGAGPTPVFLKTRDEGKHWFRGSE